MNKLSVKTYIIKLLKRYPQNMRYDLLAADLGVTSRYIRYLEKGRPPSDHLRRLIKLTLEKA